MSAFRKRRLLSPAKRKPKSFSDRDRDDRRAERMILRRDRQHDMFAMCGFRYYSSSPADRERGTYWKTCARCGQPLTYYKSIREAEKRSRVCET